MTTDWSTRRKFTYAAGIIFFIAVALIYTYRDTLFPTPTCFDKKQNGYESGVDCGGTCSLRCKEEIIPISVSWSRAILTSSSTYDFVALLSNKNLDNAPRSLNYTFIAYDQTGAEFYTESGTTKVPVDGDFPVVLQNIALKKKPAQVSVQLQNDVPHYKTLENPTDPIVKVAGERFEAGSISRVYATIVNTKRVALSNLPVRVLLYDADGNAYAAGETLVPSLGKEEAKQIVFTWDYAFPENPTKIRVVPILDPFSSSVYYQ